MRGRARQSKTSQQAMQFNGSIPMAGLRLYRLAVLGLNGGTITSAERVRAMQVALGARCLRHSVALVQRMSPATSHRDVGPLVLAGRQTHRSKRPSLSRYSLKKKACSCFSTEIMRSSPHEEVARLFGVIAILFGYWIVFKSDSLSGNCLFFPPSGFQVCTTLV